jgi:hypothetical protein
LETFLDQWLGEVVAVTVISVAGYIINFVRMRGKKIKENNALAEQNRDDIILIKKALIIALKHIDRQTEKAHGEDPEIACMVKDLLTDNILNGK